jgi:hypothetical protein
MLQQNGAFATVRHDATAARVRLGLPDHAVLTPLLSTLLTNSLNGESTLPTVNRITDAIPTVLPQYEEGFHRHQDDAKRLFETLLPVILSETDTTVGFALPAVLRDWFPILPPTPEQTQAQLELQQQRTRQQHASLLRDQFQSWWSTVHKYHGGCGITTTQYADNNTVIVDTANPDGLPGIKLGELIQSQFGIGYHIPADPVTTICEHCQVQAYLLFHLNSSIHSTCVFIKRLDPASCDNYHDRCQLTSHLDHYPQQTPISARARCTP